MAATLLFYGRLMSAKQKENRFLIALSGILGNKTKSRISIFSKVLHHLFVMRASFAELMLPKYVSC